MLHYWLNLEFSTRVKQSHDPEVLVSNLSALKKTFVSEILFLFCLLLSQDNQISSGNIQDTTYDNICQLYILDTLYPNPKLAHKLHLASWSQLSKTSVVLGFDKFSALSLMPLCCAYDACLLMYMLITGRFLSSWNWGFTNKEDYFYCYLNINYQRLLNRKKNINNSDQKLWPSLTFKFLTSFFSEITSHYLYFFLPCHLDCQNLSFCLLLICTFCSSRYVVEYMLS